MDYKQFIQILKDESNFPDSVQMLNEFVNEFPYFQTAHSLLAREMFRQQNIRYEKQLKIAAAHSSDRKALHNLVHPKKTNIFSTEPVVEHPHYVSENISESPDTQNIFEAETVEMVPPDTAQPAEEPQMHTEEVTASYEKFAEEVPSPPPTHSPVSEFTTDFSEEPEPVFEEELPPSDPHEIIRRRLNEILGLAKAETIDTPQKTKESAASETTPVENKVDEKGFNDQHISSDNAETVHDEIKEIHAGTFSEIAAEPKEKTATEEKPGDIIDQIVAESNKAVDEIDRGELEYALEATLIQSLEKLPIIEKQTPVVSEKEKTGEPITFLEWLKMKSTAGYGNVEEVKAYDEVPQVETTADQSAKTDSIALIDRFIKDDPKIVASKVEFYSPAIQAKKSITEDEDLVSETLAGIYRHQGNTMKARSMYEKLSLLFPEKKAYFAALISEIDSEINQQHKEDL
jgi:hypothetical protein